MRAFKLEKKDKLKLGSYFVYVPDQFKIKKRARLAVSCLMPPSCSFCEHYLGDDPKTEKECLAFHEIPDEIITGVCDHTQPYHGDHNILFKLNEDLREDYEEVKLIKKELFSFENKEKKKGINNYSQNMDLWS